MSLDATLQPLILPEGTEFPGTPQELLDLIAQYVAITGLNPFSGINYGPTTPDPSNRDLPWFKTDGSGNPIGWFSWNGAAWTPIPLTLPAGPTADRPSSPPVGTQYLDTDINVALVFERSQWRTLAGSPGDVKSVKAATIEAALTLNPGWVQDPTSLGRVIGGAGEGPGLTPRTYGEQAGEETTLIAEDNLPAHVHTYQGQATPARWKADGNATDAAGNLAGYAANGDENTGSVGEANPVATLQPTVFYWCICKS